MVGDSIKIKKSEFETVFLTFYFAISPISKLLEKIGIPRPVTYVVMIVTGLIFIINRLKFLNRKIDVFIAFMIFGAITLFAVLLHHSDFNSTTEMYALIIIFFPAYFIFRAANIDKLIRALHIYAYIGFAIFLPNAFFVKNVGHDYLAFAYDILLPLCIIVYYARKERHWYDIVLSIVGTIILAVFGSRGALIALVLYFIYLNFEKGYIRKILILSGITVLGYIIYSNIGSIVSRIQSFGISSYLLNRIANNEAFESVSRIRLFEYITSELLHNNYFGVGPLGNRALMPVIRYKMPYPHQLFFELMIDYGLIIGGLFSVLIIIAVLYLIIKSKDKYRYLTGLFCIAAFFPLMLSGTLYTVGTVPYILALFFNFRDQKMSFNTDTNEGD
ncbi:MAG: hypothetical protein IKI20_04320 [Lachnospiraceae bacterium]|nr:hypothetical protein [Lachnospiraceae bacterium]